MWSRVQTPPAVEEIMIPEEGEVITRKGEIGGVRYERFLPERRFPKGLPSKWKALKSGTQTGTEMGSPQQSPRRYSARDQRQALLSAS